MVNLDPTLSEVMSEVRYLVRPPLSLPLPPALRQLAKSTDYTHLKHRQTSLQVRMYAHTYIRTFVRMYVCICYQPTYIQWNPKILGPA